MDTSYRSRVYVSHMQVKKKLQLVVKMFVYLCFSPMAIFNGVELTVAAHQ